MNPLMLISALVTSYMCYVQGQSQCNGNCIFLNDCPDLYSIVVNPERTRVDTDRLRKAFCRYQDGKALVCCNAEKPDDSCFTPDGQPGRCVDLYSCPHLAESLQQKPLSRDTVLFAQNSRCDGPAQYSVCCGPAVRPSVGPSSVCEPSAAPPDRRTNCCGLEAQANRIFGGTKTSIDQYPWLALIEYRGKDYKIKLLCGGALISQRYVLTAGHCVAGAVTNVGTAMNVRLGEYDTSNEGKDCDEVEGGGIDCTEGLVIIPIEKTIPHPQYDPQSNLRRHDIALIRMAQLAPYTDFIRPICLPISDLTANPPTNFSLYAAGWGAVDQKTSASNVKLHVDLPFNDAQTCQAAYSLPRRNVPLWKGQLCAGGVAGKDSCKGDSGGPLMYQNENLYEVIGIVSFGTTPCGIENVPGVYTKVYEYNSWIRSQIKP